MAPRDRRSGHRAAGRRAPGPARAGCRGPLPSAPSYPDASAVVAGPPATSPPGVLPPAGTPLGYCWPRPAAPASPGPADPAGRQLEAHLLAGSAGPVADGRTPLAPGRRRYPGPPAESWGILAPSPLDHLPGGSMPHMPPGAATLSPRAPVARAAGYEEDWAWWLLVMAGIGCADRADCRFHDHLKPLAVRAAPVHPAAARAARKRLIATPRAGPQQRLDVGLAGECQRPVARRAPGPWRQRRGEPVQHVSELLVRARAPHIGAAPQLPAAQQPAILGQQHPPAGVRLPDQGVIVTVIGVGGIHARQPQPARQRPQVDVENEPRRYQPLRPAHGTDVRHIPAAGPVSG